MQEEELWLLPDKAIYWPTQEALLVSDIHLGKIDHFRKHGIAVPSKAATDNYRRLAQLISRYEITDLLILGDLFHSSHNEDWAEFCAFRKGYPDVTFTLIEGNHDILDQEVLREGLDHIVDHLIKGPFYLTHEPTSHPDLYNLCGHIHPAIYLEGIARQRMKLPCFYFGESVGVLPAFGTFTGMHRLDAREAKRVFVLVEGEVMAYR